MCACPGIGNRGPSCARNVRLRENLLGALLRNQAAPLDADANTLKVGRFALLPVASECGPTFRVFAHRVGAFAPMRNAAPFLVALSPDGGPELRMTIMWGARDNNAMSKDRVTACVISVEPVPLA